MSVNPDAIPLETHEFVLLRRTRQYGDFDEENRERIFREHLGHTLSMVASGKQLAAGPITDSPAEDEQICGFGRRRNGQRSGANPQRTAGRQREREDAEGELGDEERQRRRHVGRHNTDRRDGHCQD